jgi:hypothetical protein
MSHIIQAVVKLAIGCLDSYALNPIKSLACFY